MKNYKFSTFILLLLAVSMHINAQLIESQFLNPPTEVKPKTWYHVMSANMTKEGLTKDIESIAKVGIGGILMFNVTQGIPIGNVVYNSPKHHELIKHAASECQRVGISFGVHNCDGWTSSGGPWITPENAMKMVVHQSTLVTGGKALNLKLTKPTARHGFYYDIAVVAYPSLPSESEENALKPLISSSDPEFDKVIISDKLLDRTTTIKKNSNVPAFVSYDFGKPVTIRSISLLQTSKAEFILEKSDNGIDFTKVIAPTTYRTGKSEYGLSQSFIPATARYFRLIVSETAMIFEINLSNTTIVDNTLGRTNLSRTNSYSLSPIGSPESNMIIAKNQIIDLTGSMDSTGTLKTTLPVGKWTILRVGYTTTGAVNVPSSKEGKGLEVDKFSQESLKIHYDSFVKKVIDNAKPVAPNALQYIEIDSYEVGGQNWTRNLQELFKKEYKYDLVPFLPLFAGRFVESAEASDAVLYDLRKLHSKLMVSNYYGYFTELAHADGVKTYIEPYGNGPFNNLEAGGKADFTMGEFWLDKGTNVTASAVSSAHIYGKKIISAESFTSESKNNWKGHPGMAKNMGDKIWTDGVNEFMFHRFVHQANTHVVPGMTMNRWGFHFDRTQTWWENAGAAWFKYMARGQFLLQQGNPANDVMLYIGEAAPNDVTKQIDSKFPDDIKFDCVNTEVLLNRVKIIDGKITLPEGTVYKALILKNAAYVSLALVQKLDDLTQQGMVLIGEKPVTIPGYAVNEQDKLRFKELVDKVWKRKNCYASMNWTQIFDEQNIKPEFISNAKKPVNYIKRSLGNGAIYFIQNPDTAKLQIQCKFKVTGMLPEKWNASTGEIVKLAAYSEKDGYTTIPLSMDENESVFIVFRSKNTNTKVISSSQQVAFSYNNTNKIVATAAEAGKVSVNLSDSTNKTLKVKLPLSKPVTGNWAVDIANKKVVFEKLVDWKDHMDVDIKYFSGTAIYSNTFEIKGVEVKPTTRI